MFRCGLDTSVPDWVIDHPDTLVVFQQLGIDYCCGGKSLAFACRERGLDANAVIEQLRLQISVAAERPSLSQPILTSIQVGLPHHLGIEGATDPLDRPWATGFLKQPIVGPVRLGTANLDGDGQVDLVHHGGRDKAVLACSADHYRQWKQALNLPELPYGAFGENFTISGLTEADVCIGDVWRVGLDVVLQVSQPRQPCWKLARRWRIKTLARQVQESGRTGWYFRVHQQGMVEANMVLTLLQRKWPTWTVSRANRIMHIDKDDLQSAAELTAVEALALNWKTTLRRRVERNEHPNVESRLVGPNE